MAIKLPIFALQGREGVPNRKKVAKMRGFLFLLSRRGCLSLLCNGLASSLFFRRLRWLVPVSWIRCGKARRARALGRAVCSAHVPCSWKAQVVRVEVPLALARQRACAPFAAHGALRTCLLLRAAGVRLCLACDGCAAPLGLWRVRGYVWLGTGVAGVRLLFVLLHLCAGRKRNCNER